MKIILIIVLVLTGFTLFAATPFVPSPIVVYRKTKSVQITPDGSLELLKSASWEDAAYALLDLVKDVDLARQTCNNELTNLKFPKPVEKEAPKLLEKDVLKK